MKKLGLVLLGIIAAIVFLANLGSLIGLAISALVTYAGFHYFRKTNSTFKKWFWGAVMLIGLLTAISNIPAFFGIIALIGVLYVWRKWNEEKENHIISATENDPFLNFEREWNNIKR